MLISIVIAISPTLPTYLEEFYGRQLQAWFLREVRRYSPAMAEFIHTGNGPHPYTVSTLYVPKAGRLDENSRIQLIPGMTCLFRITSLSYALSDLIIRKIIPGLPGRLQLKWSEFKIDGQVQDSKWAKQTTFWDLAQNRYHSTDTASITFEFFSPTAFRSNGIDLALPTPDHVWRSLHNRWKAFSPRAQNLLPIFPELAANCVVVSDFQLRSMKVIFKGGQKGAATGCMGQATYRLLQKDRCGDYGIYWDELKDSLHTLANFALYSGIGHHTTIGLGQTRYLIPKNHLDRENILDTSLLFMPAENIYV